MELLLRILRALILGVICFGCLNYLGFGNEAIFISLGVIAFGTLTFFFKWSAIFTGVVIAWAAVHLLFKVPGPSEISAFTSSDAKSASETARSDTPFTSRLSDIEAAKKNELITEDEYILLRQDAIQDELHRK